MQLCLLFFLRPVLLVSGEVSLIEKGKFPSGKVSVHSLSCKTPSVLGFVERCIFASPKKWRRNGLRKTCSGSKQEGKLS